MNLFKSKTTQQIEAIARKKERAICEKELIELRQNHERELLEQKEILESKRTAEENLYNRQLRERSNNHEAAMKKLKKDLEEKHSLEIRNLNDKFLIEKNDSENKIRNLKIIIKDNHDAWRQIMKVFPQVMSLISTLRAKAEIKALKAGKELNEYNNMENDSEIIERKMKRLSPGIEQLLHFSDVILMEEGE